MGKRCGGGFHSHGCGHGFGGVTSRGASIHGFGGGGGRIAGYSTGGYRGGGGGYRPRYYSSYTPKAPPSYTPEAMNAVQSAISKRQAEDAERLNRVGSFQIASDDRTWHEYHGVGSLLPDGNIAFNDNTASGRHSHTVHNVDPNNPGNATPGWSRPEGQQGR